MGVTGTMQETQRRTPRSSRGQQRPNKASRDHTAHNGHVPRPTPSQFDLVVTFATDDSARHALFSLREAGFGPDQAVLLTRGPLAQDEFELAVDDLRSESWTAFAIVVATELALGILLGCVIGWLVGLFRNEPAIGPVWQPLIVFGAAGFLTACVAAFFEWRRWRRVHVPTPGEAAVALRLRGPSAPQRLSLAQSVLEQYGGQRELG
jgi:hypothetical protein